MITPNHQHDKRSAPDKQGFRLQRRIEAHEFAVAVRHELEYRIIALTGNQHFAYLPAKIGGKLDIRVGNRFVLAYQTTQLQGDALEARLQRRILELTVGVQRLRRLPPGAPLPRAERTGKQDAAEDAKGARAIQAPPRRAAAIRGKNSCSQISGVIGEMNLYSTRPCPSTRNVSGAP